MATDLRERVTVRTQRKTNNPSKMDTPDEEAIGSTVNKSMLLLPMTQYEFRPRLPATPQQRAHGESTERVFNHTPQTTTIAYSTIEDALFKYNEAAVAIFSAITKAANAFRRQIEKAEEIIDVFGYERAIAVKKADRLQQQLEEVKNMHKEELKQIREKNEEQVNKIQESYEERLKKVREELAAQHKKHADRLLDDFLRQKGNWDKAVNEPRKLREENKKLAEANKILQKQASAGGVSKKQHQALKDCEAELQTRCTNLHKDLMNSNAKLDTKTRDLIELQLSHDQLPRTTVESSSKIANLEKEVQDLAVYQLSHQTMLRASVGSRNKITSLEKQLRDGIRYGSSHDDLLRASVSFQTKITDLKKQIQSLEGQVEELKLDQENKSELVKIGAAVRTRRMERVKTILYGTPRELLDKGLIENGNYAAHRANGMADAALFRAGILSDEWKEVFKDMYGRTFETYELKTRKYQRNIEGVDLWSMVETGVPKGSNSRDTESNRRRRAMIKEVSNLWTSMSPREVRESTILREKLDQLRLATKEVLDTEQQNSGRRPP